MQSDQPATYGRRVNPILTAEYHRGRKPGNAGKRYPAEPLAEREVLALMAYCGRGPGGYRNRALIAVMWRSGLRVSEALALAPKDVNFELGAITVLHGKGDKRRMVHMDQQTAGLLELWLSRRNQLVGMPRGAPVFCTYETGRLGRPIRDAYVRDALRRAGLKAGIEKRVHPHGLRHTFAFELRSEGVDLPTISEALGHNDFGTTQRYISHLAPLDRVRKLQGRSWPHASGAGGDERPSAPSPRTS
jgi:site-specific recombinase XerD